MFYAGSEWLLKPSRMEAEARAIPLHWTRYIHRTRHNWTVQKQQAERGSESRAGGCFSMGCSMGMFFLYLALNLWSISPGRCHILKPWGVDTVVNFTQACLLYFCHLSGECVRWYQVQPSLKALERFRWRFQIAECSWHPQMAAAWPRSLVWSIRGDVCPKLASLVSSTAAQRKAISRRRWDVH